MPYCITCSTKVLTLARASFLFILVDVIYEFGMVLSVYILLSPQEDNVDYSFWGHRCTYSAAHSSKRFKPLYDMLMCQGFCWIAKTQTKNSAVLWCL